MLRKLNNKSPFDYEWSFTVCDELTIHRNISELLEPLSQTRKSFIRVTDDLFTLPVEWVDAFFAVTKLSAHSVYAASTQYPRKQQAYIRDRQTPFRITEAIHAIASHPESAATLGKQHVDWIRRILKLHTASPWPSDNFMAGFTLNDPNAEKQIPALASTPAAARWLCIRGNNFFARWYEHAHQSEFRPMLENDKVIDTMEYFERRLNWVCCEQPSPKIWEDYQAQQSVESGTPLFIQDSREWNQLPFLSVRYAEIIERISKRFFCEPRDVAPNLNDIAPLDDGTGAYIGYAYTDEIGLDGATMDEKESGNAEEK